MTAAENKPRARKKLFAVLLAAAVAVMSVALLASCKEPEEEVGTTYFFDSAAASGGNGTEEKPFDDIETVGALTLLPGDRICLKRGSLFQGSLRLVGVSGSRENPVVVTAYGTGDAPKIDGNGLEGSGVLLIENCSHVIVEQLEIFDSVSKEGDRRGVLIDANNAADSDPAPDSDKIITYSNITLRNLYIHDIRGYLDAVNNGMDMTSKMTGGIQIWSSDGKGRFDGLTVTECEIYNVDNVGISSSRRKGASDPYADDFEQYAFLGVEISRNEIHNIGKNAIFVRNLYGGIIEHNVVHDTSVRCYTGNQIVTSRVNGTVIRFNEGYNNMARKNDLPGSNKGIMDGCMLDADLRSRYTVWEYNYSHDNSFGLFLNCTGTSGSDKNSKDVAVVRYNLSVCDKGNKGAVYINYYAENIEVYNNTFITGKDTKNIFQVNGAGKKFTFYNNLIYNRSATGAFDLGDEPVGSCSHNLVYSQAGCSVKNLGQVCGNNVHYTFDPLFENIVSDSIEGRIGYDTAIKLCRLLSSSSALDGGRAIEVKGVDRDFAGNPYRPSIGCYAG